MPGGEASNGMRVGVRNVLDPIQGTFRTFVHPTYEEAFEALVATHTRLEEQGFAVVLSASEPEGAADVPQRQVILACQRAYHFEMVSEIVIGVTAATMIMRPTPEANRGVASN